MPEIKNPQFPSFVEETTEHTSDEELSKILGVIPGFENLNDGVPNENVPARNEIVTLDENIKLPEQLEEKSAFIQTPTNDTEQPPTPIVKEEQQQQPSNVVQYTQEQINDLIANAVLEESKKWESIQTSFEEFQKDPYQFYAKYSPHIIEKFDDAGWVQSKLNEEFGDDFEFDPTQIQIYNTPSNKYMRRQLELSQQAESIKKTALETNNTTANQSAEQIENYKKQVASKHNITDEAKFNQIWGELSSLSTVDVCDRLVELALMKEKLDTLKSNAGRVPQNSFPSTPGVSQVNGNNIQRAPTDEENLLTSMFSSDAISNLKLIR